MHRFLRSRHDFGRDFLKRFAGFIRRTPDSLIDGDVSSASGDGDFGYASEGGNYCEKLVVKCSWIYLNKVKAIF